MKNVCEDAVVKLQQVKRESEGERQRISSHKLRCEELCEDFGAQLDTSQARESKNGSSHFFVVRSPLILLWTKTGPKV